MEFLQQYKFSFHSKTRAILDTQTEKILQAKTAGCIPIYWGNPEISRDFDTKNFVNAHDYKDFGQCIEAILRLDRDDDAFRSMQKTPLLRENKYTEYSDKVELKRWLCEILSHRPKRFRSRVLYRFDEMRNRWVSHLIDVVNSKRFKKA